VPVRESVGCETYVSSKVEVGVVSEVEGRGFGGCCFVCDLQFPVVCHSVHDLSGYFPWVTLLSVRTDVGQNQTISNDNAAPYFLWVKNIVFNL
jgi:hypothetical protein